MRTQIQCALPILLLVLQAQARPRGELIGGTPIANTNTIVSSLAQSTNAVSQTNQSNIASLGFDELSGFPIVLTPELELNTNRPAWADAQINDKIPKIIKAYDGKKVIVEGFMLPTDYDAHGKVTEFVVMKNQMSCCYGGTPQIHEFAMVKVTGPGVSSMMDVPIRVKGVLHVGAHRENGSLNTIYRMEAEAVSETGYH